MISIGQVNHPARRDRNKSPRTGMFGYHGQYLRIDLATGTATPMPIPESILREHIGGSGLGAWLLVQESQPRQDPLAPSSPLIFVFSPLVGSPLTTSAKFAVVGHSPLTGRINDSLSSSHFAIAGKKTGSDAFVIVGQAPEWSTLIIDGDNASLISTPDLVGKTSREATDLLRNQLGAGFRFVAIGPAGEHLVRYATISHEGRHAGRGGMGALMGSKRLKAIAVRGQRPTSYAHAEQLIEYGRNLSQLSMGPAAAKYRELGTVSNLLVFNRLGTLPTRNFQQGSFEAGLALAPEHLPDSIPRTRSSCAACTIGCEHLFHLPGRKTGVRMEYENLFALGPLCGISDPETVLEASRLCDDYGLDTISAGGTIAFAMECTERGWLPDSPLRFGAGSALLQALGQIARREGIGDLLAHGSRYASRQIGPQAEQIAPHVKGLEIAGYEPRALQGMALGFAVNPRGADHNRSGAYQLDFSEESDRLNLSPEMVPRLLEIEDEATLMDSLILCKFLRGVFPDKRVAMAEMLHLVTGWDITPDELTATARRIINVKKQFNVLQGWTPEEDTLPRRFFESQLAGGASAGAMIDEAVFRQTLQAYNLARGWSPEGWL
ncbi:MAG: aldehyde ferredoxin oxidoreductase family protein [Planctomycetales bacterium]